MARSYPADVKLQSFFTEQYEKEAAARLSWYLDNKQGKVASAGIKRVRGAAVPDGLPKINPNTFARSMKKEHERNMMEVKAKAQREQSEEEMFMPDSKTKDKLYIGFTKEENGRYQYLKDRKDIVPEKKYSFPIVSSWDYGWKLNDQFQLKRPKHARTRMVQDTFYTRNTIPTLEDPTVGFRFERSKTILT